MIVTDSREHALFWKEQISQFLEKEMRLTLSMEKTLITDIRKKYIGFLGYEYKVVRGKSRKGYIPRTIPNRERLKRKVAEIHKNIVSIPRNVSRDIIVQLLFLYDVGVRSGEKIQTVSPACGTQDAEEIQSQMDSCQRNLNTAECSQPI